MNFKELEKSRFAKSEFWTHIVPMIIGIIGAFMGLPDTTIQAMSTHYVGLVDSLFRAFELLLTVLAGLHWGKVTTEQKKALAEAKATAEAAKNFATAQALDGKK